MLSRMVLPGSYTGGCIAGFLGEDLWRESDSVAWGTERFLHTLDRGRDRECGSNWGSEACSSWAETHA